MSKTGNESEDYKGLLKKYLENQKQLETVNQTLHDCKRQLKISEALENEYRDEINLVQTKANEKYIKLEAKIHHYEENITIIKNTSEERIFGLTKELQERDEEIEMLKNDLQRVNALNVVVKLETDDDNKVEELVNLKEIHEKLNVEFVNLKSAYNMAEEQNIKLDRTLTELKSEMENLRESYDCKRAELDEANALIQTLKDDLICANEELNTIKAKPLGDNAKGNSLFAEVDDKRVELQTDMKKMKHLYLDMKRQVSEYVKKINRLSNENAMLSAGIEKEIMARDTDSEMIVDSYKEQIQSLNEIISDLKKQLTDKNNVFNSDMSTHITVFEGIISRKDKEIDELQQKMLLKSSNQTSLSIELAEAHRENRRVNLQLTQLQNEIWKMQSQIKDLELQKAVDENREDDRKVEELNRMSSRRDTIWANLSHADKENTKTPVTRAVHFAEDTKDTCKGPAKRAAKVLVSKPIIIKSIPRNTK